MDFTKLSTPSLSIGPVRPKYRPNDINDPPVVWTTTQYQTCMSDLASNASVQVVRGGQVLYPFSLGVKPVGSTTSIVQDIPLNTLGNVLYGTATNEQSEPVGVDHDTNPPAITQFVSGYEYARVISTDLDITATSITDQHHVLEMYALIYRSDLGIPSGFEPGSATTPANIQQTPGLIKWRSKNNATQGDWIGRGPMTKRLTFDIPKFFNDVEWAYDNPASTASTTNFWVRKDANGLFTAAPNVKLTMRLYARVMNPDNDADESFNIGLRFRHKVEFHRAQTVLPGPAITVP